MSYQVLKGTDFLGAMRRKLNEREREREREREKEEKHRTQEEHEAWKEEKDNVQCMNMLCAKETTS